MLPRGRRGEMDHFQFGMEMSLPEHKIYGIPKYFLVMFTEIFSQSISKRMFFLIDTKFGLGLADANLRIPLGKLLHENNTLAVHASIEM